MIQLFLLTDYKDRFGLKWNAKPYRSGYNRDLLSKCFAIHGIKTQYVRCSEALRQPSSWAGQLVLYTSCEEMGNNYKMFIEDVVYGLEDCGAHVIPPSPFLRAHNNKVFMEILRNQLLGEELSGLYGICFGTMEEIAAALEKGQVLFPCVIKSAHGAMSRGVAMARDGHEVLKIVKRLSRTPHYIHELRDYLRTKKMSGYRLESPYQGKFIVQPFIAGLDGDWKVLVYGDQYYALKRHVHPGDFRASGSHCNYLPGRHSGIPATVLSFVEKVYNRLDTPHLSVDVAFDGKRPYLFEFQSVYFGTSTQHLCEEYFTRHDGSWVPQPKVMNQEEVFAWGVVHWLQHRSDLQRSCSV